MKITIGQLRQVIKEEVFRINESFAAAAAAARPKNKEDLLSLLKPGEKDGLVWVGSKQAKIVNLEKPDEILRQWDLINGEWKEQDLEKLESMPRHDDVTSPAADDFWRGRSAAIRADNERYASAAKDRAYSGIDDYVSRNVDLRRRRG
jgi:hypothetical protein